MDQLGYLLALLAILFIAGLLGGVVNYLMSLDDPNREKTAEAAAAVTAGLAGSLEDPRLLRRSLITGVAASFIVPLFLRLSSGGTDDLVIKVLKADSPNRAADLLVIAAFCLVAAISARSFIQTVSDRVLQQAKAANRKAQEAQDQVEKIQDERTEDEIDETAPADKAAAQRGAPLPDEDSIKLLTAMNDSTYYRRSTSGLTKETKLARARAVALLEALVEAGQVEKALSKKDGTPRWKITSEGRTLVLRSRLA